MNGIAIKGDAVFKRTYNRAIDHLAIMKPGDVVESENSLKRRFEASRTTVRKVLAELGANGLISLDGTSKIVLRRPRQKDIFPRSETTSISVQVEKKFMEWMLRTDPKHGDVINERNQAASQ